MVGAVDFGDEPGAAEVVFEAGDVLALMQREGSARRMSEVKIRSSAALAPMSPLSTGSRPTQRTMRRFWRRPEAWPGRRRNGR